MRKAFINTLRQLARKDKNIFLLTADLGFSVFEGFREEFPSRFFNIGVAEANMAGISAGLALSGKTVFMYSIAPFATLRCLEQIRNDICHQRLKVRIIGVGAGLSYGTAGPTHYSIEDIAIMRALPNMAVISPADPWETKMAIQASLHYDGPIYFRLGKGTEENLNSTTKFRIGKARIIREGTDITIIGTGSILFNALQAADNLKKKGMSIQIISMHTIKPIDKNAIIKAAIKTKKVFTIEEHNINGGLGSTVGEILAETKTKTFFKRIALPDIHIERVGSQHYLRGKFGLDTKDIEKVILKAS